MFTPIDKNLLIAALESALLYAQNSAGVPSLEDLTAQISALRLAFDADPANVSDEQINAMIATLQALEIPDPAQLSRLLTVNGMTDTNTYLAVCSWATLLNKPATFPPSAHAHPWSQITYKPITFPPSAHPHPELAADWNTLANKPTTFPPSAHPHPELAADWNTLANKPTTFPPATHTHTDLAADWNTLANKPATFPAEDHQHTRQRFCLSVGFDGAFSSGMERSIVLPLTLMSAQLLFISFALGNTGSSSYTSFGLDAWVFDDTAGTEIWKSCIVNPADPPIAIISGGYPKDFIGVPDKVSMGKMTLPKAEWNGNDWLRLTILQAATGAADASLTLEFDATFEAFESE